MKTSCRLIAVTFILTAFTVSAASHYVSLNGQNPTSPYTTWATAATNIQQAVDAAATDDEVVVTNGVYFGSVQLSTRLLLRSVNGPRFTIINGAGTNSCVSLPQDASLCRVTLTNGYSTYGGGVRCTLTNAFVTNCIVTGNSATWGGGAAGCTLYDCSLIGNSAQSGGGAGGCRLYNCTLTDNSAQDGGGASGSWLYNCTVISNSVVVALWHANGGGGVENCTLQNCTVSGNSASGDSSEGGGALSSSLGNCTLVDNSATYAGGGSCRGYLYNCTLTGNSATYGGGSSGDQLFNTICYFNTAPSGANYDTSYISLIIYNCCTTPMPPGGGNITSAPLFVNYSAGNLRLQSSSPCINAGNNSYGVATTDLDGRPRLVGGTVDMGAYEFQPGISGAFIGWLQQYGLPTDGSADYIDSDGDGMNNWQEWVCGTDPTNAGSVLEMLSLARGTSGVDVAWLSVTNRTYFVQRSTNLTPQPSFVTLFTNIAGQMGSTTLTDTNTTSERPFFYRVGVVCP